MKVAPTTVEYLAGMRIKPEDVQAPNPKDVSLDDFIKIILALAANAGEVRTSASDHGMIYVIFGEQLFRELYPNATLTVPTDPGPFPDVNEFNAALLVKTYERKENEHLCMVNFNDACYQFVADATSNEFLAPLQDAGRPGMQAPFFKLLAYYRDVFRATTLPTDITNAELRMLTKWSLEDPFAQLTRQMETGRLYLDFVGQPISATVMITKALTLLQQTGHFTDEITRWNEKTSDKNDWRAFTEHFHRLVAIKKKTATPAGQTEFNAAINAVTGTYGPAAAAQQPATPLSEVVEALAMMMQQQQVQQQQQQTAQAQMQQSYQDLLAQQQTVQAMMAGQGNVWTATPGDYTRDKWWYCWTHSTSASCNDDGSRQSDNDARHAIGSSTNATHGSCAVHHCKGGLPLSER